LQTTCRVPLDGHATQFLRGAGRGAGCGDRLASDSAGERRDTDLVALSLRPSFSLDLPMRARDVIEWLCAELETAPLHVRRTREPGSGRDARARDHDHLVLTVPTSQQSFWSPWLMLDVTPRDDGARLHGKFSPHPSVWTGFVFGYLTLSVVCLVALVIAASSVLVPGSGQSWALWLAAGAALAIAGLWSASQVGQRLARTQMEHLKRELDRALQAPRAGR